MLILESNNISLIEQTSDLHQKNKDLQEQINSLYAAGEVSEVYEEYLLENLNFIATKLDELDTMLVKDNSNNVDMVNWFIENAEFPQDGTFETAVVLIGQWKAQNEGTGAEYLQLKFDIQERLDQLEEINRSFEEGAD